MSDFNTSFASLLSFHRERPKLLVVDDQPINVQALYRIFSSDCTVFMATNGAEAFEVCRRNLPDLVLLDVNMPGMDGFAACALLKADEATADIPVIFVTAHDEPESEMRGLDAGAADFISKPVNPALIRARVRTQLTMKYQADRLRDIASTDGLTGLFTRRLFDARLATEWQRASRNGSSLSLLLLDVDFFKRYNDHYGHVAGDECLVKVASAVKQRLNRPADVAARYGGEEFACILPETDFPGALKLAKDIEVRVRALHIAHACSDAAAVVTISVGVTTKAPGWHGGAIELLELADARLYSAKRSGRGQVCGEIAGAGLVATSARA